MTTYRRAVLYLVALSLITSACGRGGNNDPLAIGVRRVALNLTFAKEELKVPIEPQVIINLLPPIEGLNGPDDLSKFATGGLTPDRTPQSPTPCCAPRPAPD